MKDIGRQASPAEKEMARARITEQVDAFLQAGGKIDVLVNGGAKVRVSTGGTWDDEFEFMHLSEQVLTN